MIKISQTLKWCCLALLFLLGGTLVQAQTKAQLNGIVTTEAGEPLSGVTVTVRLAGSKDTLSISSDERGVFVVTALNTGSKYNFNFTHIGFQEQQVKNFEIKAGVNNSMIVRMKEVPAGLNEVVVIGYGSVKKKDLTGA
ncbi:MAG TPA: carboxypeptidase regulatory-like domain-containing protein, partial [Pseudobacter sp.]|nr:carboxypeptidase regulatory-like domain-containing protein [Pseudobacter sp.]